MPQRSRRRRRCGWQGGRGNIEGGEYPNIQEARRRDIPDPRTRGKGGMKRERRQARSGEERRGWPPSRLVGEDAAFRHAEEKRSMQFWRGWVTGGMHEIDAVTVWGGSCIRAKDVFD